MASLMALSILIVLVPGICSGTEMNVGNFSQDLTERLHGLATKLEVNFHSSPATCCFHYSSCKHLHVARCYPTSSTCHKPAIIVVTSTGRQICVHPKNAEDCCTFP